MLTVQHLRKIYNSDGREVEAIRDVSFEVTAGEFVTIVGPSGAGKTTLLRCACGLLEPTSGELAVNGRPVDGPPPEMAVVFQDYSRSLMPWFTVAGNVDLPLRNTIRDRVERAERVRRALDQVGLHDFGDHYPWQLSGGMQQRVAIARALAYEPAVLLMDEPFASVDAQTRADLEDLVLKVRDESEVTIVLVTHDIDEAVYLGDRVVVLSARPTVLVEAVKVDLPRTRDQLSTKSLPEFVRLRSHILQLIRRPAVAPADVSEPSTPA